MTTYAAARAELAAVLPGYHEASGEGEPPTSLIFGDGMDLTHIVRGAALATFRILAIAPGQWSDGKTSETLGTHVMAVIAALRALSAWVIVSVGPDVVRDVAGQSLLTADIRVQRSVDI